MSFAITGHTDTPQFQGASTILIRGPFSSGRLRNIKHQFTSVIERRGKWYVAYIEEIPGVNTQGRTLAEARRNLKEALAMVIGANRELAARIRTRDAMREPITVNV